MLLKTILLVPMNCTFLGPITDERGSEKREENRSESQRSSFRRSDEFKNEKLASKAPVSHRNGGNIAFVIPYQENQQISIPNPNPQNQKPSTKMQDSKPNPENQNQR